MNPPQVYMCSPSWTLLPPPSPYHPSKNTFERKHILMSAAAKSLQSCPTLCDPMDSSPRGSPVPGILQARTLEWVAVSFSNAWKWKVKVKSLSLVQLLATPWTAAHQLLHPWDFWEMKKYEGNVLLSRLEGHMSMNAPKVPWLWACIHSSRYLIRFTEGLSSPLKRDPPPHPHRDIAFSTDPQRNILSEHSNPVSSHFSASLSFT